MLKGGESGEKRKHDGSSRRFQEETRNNEKKGQALLIKNQKTRCLLKKFVLCCIFMITDVKLLVLALLLSSLGPVQELFTLHNIELTVPEPEAEGDQRQKETAQCEEQEKHQERDERARAR
jgi:hypothetical protein